MLLATPDRKVESHIGNDATSFAMGIDADALHLVMDQLAGLYSDQISAILREYATNAVDAHKMAGITRPIEVTLPGPLSPLLRIQDFGIGLDIEDLRLIYSQYGASTKRQSNDFNGQLGFGCKAALAYSDVFNVTSVKDGRKIFAAVSKETGVPMFHVLGDEPTTEGNGTTVEVPVGNRYDQTQFAEKATVVYGHFDKGLVLINGKPPIHYTDGLTLSLSDDIGIVSNGRGYGRMDSAIIMGNVRYPADIDHGLIGSGVIVRVPIGAVEFSPSRESLRVQHPNTKATIARIESEIRSLLTGAVQRDVTSSATPGDALAAVRKWRGVIHHKQFPAQGSLTYKGREVPTALKIGGAIPKHADGTDNEAAAPHYIIVNYNSHRQNAHQRVRAIAIDAIEDAVWVKGYSPLSFTASHKKKLVKWADERLVNQSKSRPRTFILTPTNPPAFWVDSKDVIDWETDIKPIKLDTTTARAGRYGSKPTGSYEAWVDGVTTHVQAADIDTTKPLFYYQGNRYAPQTYNEILSKAHPKGYTLVYMPGNRIAKFQRDFPSAVGARRGCEEAFEAWRKGLTEDQLKALWLSDTGLLSSLSTLGQYPGRIEDPDIREGIRIARIDVQDLKNQRDAFRYVADTRSVKGIAVKDPLKRYTLLNDGYSTRISAKKLDHVAIYLNCAYRAFNDGRLK